MLIAKITKEKMLCELHKIIGYIEQDSARVRLSMDSEPMIVYATKINDPLTEPDRYTLTIEVERILKC